MLFVHGVKFILPAGSALSQPGEYVIALPRQAEFLARGPEVIMIFTSGYQVSGLYLNTRICPELSKCVAPLLSETRSV